MQDICTLRTSKLLIIAAAVIALALSPRARAGGYKCHCEPSIAVYSSPFFGYYRTCWRPWPGGQPPCPCYVMEQTGAPAARPGTTGRTIEQLPLPKPEEPDNK
jgi:hypothetical protein